MSTSGVYQFDGWRDIAWFDGVLDQAARGSFDSLWFLTGNCIGLLRQAKRRARDTSFWIPVGPEAPNDRNDTLAAGAGLAAAAVAIANPIAGLAVALGEVGRQILRSRGAQGQEDLFQMLDDLLQAAEKAASGVVLLTAPNRADQDRWVELFVQISARYQSLRRRRLIILVGLPDAPINLTEVDDNYPHVVKTAAALVDAGLARWHGVPTLDVSTVVDRVGASAPVAQSLITFSAGDDALAFQLWNEWRQSRFVERDGRRQWRWVGPEQDASTSTSRLLARRFGGDVVTVRRVERALACAAIMWDEFSGEAVSRAVTAEREDWETTEEIFDELTEGRDVPPLLELRGHDTSLRDGKPTTLWRYAFLDSAVRAVFLGALEPSERRSLAQELVKHLTALYPTDSPLDAAIGRLARLAGDDKVARLAEGRRFRRDAILSARIDAALLLQVASRLEPDSGLCHELWTLALTLLRQGQGRLAIRAGEEAVRVGAGSSPIDEHELAHAYVVRGVALLPMDVERACSDLSKAASLLGRACRLAPTEQLCRDLGVSWYQLSVALLEAGHVYQARLAAVNALVILRRCRRMYGDTNEIAGALALLGQVQASVGEYGRATGRFEAAIRLARRDQAELHRDSADILFHFGRAAVVAEDFKKAVGILLQAEQLYRAAPAKYGSRGGLANTLSELGLAMMESYDHKGAMKMLREGVTLARELHDLEQFPFDRRNLIISLGRLGNCAFMLKDYSLSRSCFLEVRARVSGVPEDQRHSDESRDLLWAEAVLKHLSRAQL